MDYIIENAELIVTVSSKGCEIISARNKKTGCEYIWCGDPDAWKRHAPVFGIWSAAKKCVPFVCIEPWYGRTDGVEFQGTLKDRQWGNVLGVDETFSKEYTITLYE